MKLLIERKATTAGGELEFAFDVKGCEFLVKNFTDGDIFVRFDPADENDILIPAQMAQVCVLSTDVNFKSQIVYVTANEASEKGVEVQCLNW